MSSKYRAIPTVVDGIRFASKAEARHYGVLKLREKVGDITDLELQPEYPIVVNGVRVAIYRADFRYMERTKHGLAQMIVDVKGMATPVYRLKKKLVEAIYEITITEVRP